MSDIVAVKHINEVNFLDRVITYLINGSYSMDEVMDYKTWGRVKLLFAISVRSSIPISTDNDKGVVYVFDVLKIMHLATIDKVLNRKGMLLLGPRITDVKMRLGVVQLRELLLSAGLVRRNHLAMVFGYFTSAFQKSVPVKVGGLNYYPLEIGLRVLRKRKDDLRRGHEIFDGEIPKEARVDRGYNGTKKDYIHSKRLEKLQKEFVGFVLNPELYVNRRVETVKKIEELLSQFDDKTKLQMARSV